MKIKSPNVEEVLKALNVLQVCIPDMNKAERKELAGFLDQVADTFEANAPEETVVPHIKTISLSLADVARTVIDSYGLPGRQ